MAISNADVIDRNLDESTKQTEGNEGAETSSHDEWKNMLVQGGCPFDSFLLREIRSYKGGCPFDSFLLVMSFSAEELNRCIAAMSPFGKIFRALFQKDIHDVFRWAELLQLTSEEEMIAAEARADAIELINFKKRLKVLLELCLYLSLILETSTSKQTRRSQEDKCIVHILLLRSGVESNPGPRTWIADVDGSRKPSYHDLCDLSSCIGNGWRHLGTRLFLKQAQLDHIEHDHKGMQNQIYHMLLKSTMPPLEASLKDILMILDAASTEFMMTVDWNDIALLFANNVQEQQLKPRDVANHISARMVDVKIAALIAENQELKRIATLEPGAQKRNAEEGETSTDVKKVKQQ
ncbi:uncharacterized protein LOC128223758 isoform X2 [Mya arenaria]|uniref:uncharacterized protein LOC128223758 isoform X2 n=1 Tax=Mya arenaria TaxID=6604 RepID=UPI0022DE9900|nr:uncharacterized protein LOC128223758 isoform X2 [Mya arenaria]